MKNLALVRGCPVEPYEGDLGCTALAGQARAVAVGNDFKQLVREVLEEAGANFAREHHMVGVYGVDAVVYGRNGQQVTVLSHGVIDEVPRGGFKRTDTVKKALCDAFMIAKHRPLPILLFTSDLPQDGAAATMLSDATEDVLDVIATRGDLPGYHRLRRYLHDDPFPGQIRAPWHDSPSEWIPELFDSM